jgi:hypothetical protein
VICDGRAAELALPRNLLITSQAHARAALVRIYMFTKARARAHRAFQMDSEKKNAAYARQAYIRGACYKAFAIKRPANMVNALKSRPARINRLVEGAKRQRT